MRQLGIGQRDRARLAGAQTHGGRGSDGRDGECAATNQIGIHGEIGIREDGQIVRAHILRAVDADDPRAAAKGQRVKPCAGADVHGAGHGAEAERDTGPAVGDAVQVVIVERQHAYLSGADAHRGRDRSRLDDQCARAGQVAVDQQVRIGGQRQRVGCHRLGTINIHLARAGAQYQRVKPCMCPDIQRAGGGDIADDDIREAVEHAGEFGIAEQQGAGLAVADTDAGACRGGGDRQIVAAAQIRIDGEVGTRTEDEGIIAHGLVAVDVQLAGAGAQGHRVDPAERAHVHFAGAVASAKGEACPAIRQTREQGRIDIDGASLSIADAHAGSDVGLREQEGAGARQRSVDVRGDVGAQGERIGAHGLRAVDIDDARARLQHERRIP